MLHKSKQLVVSVKSKYTSYILGEKQTTQCSNDNFIKYILAAWDMNSPEIFSS